MNFHTHLSSGEGLVTAFQFSSGHIEVICGPMFSGKTTELLRRITRAQIARQKVQVFKPAIDVRYGEKKIVSHDTRSEEALPIENSSEIFKHLYDSTRIIAIDEVQFFDDQIVTVVSKLARRGYRVICAGLDLDYRGIPFGPIPGLLAVADEVYKIHAICTVCGAPASRTQRLIESEDQVILGEKDVYQARCRAHYDHPEPEQLLPLSEEIESNSLS